MDYTTEQIWSILSPARQSALLEENRDVNVDYDWWDFTIENFTEECQNYGIEVDREKVQFSGFWSQGDGAWFDGEVTDWSLVLTHLARGHWLDPALENCWKFSSCTGNRQHMSYDGDFPLPDNPYDAEEQPLQHFAWGVGAPSEDDLSALADAAKAYFSELAQTLYQNLENEHEYLTSDESVTRWLVDYMTVEELIGDEEVELPELVGADAQLELEI